MKSVNVRINIVIDEMLVYERKNICYPVDYLHSSNWENFEGAII